MRIKVVGSSIDGSPCQFAASYVINEDAAIDAGSIGYMAIGEQKQIRNIVISHSHLDHIGSLPLFIDNVYAPGPECVNVYGSDSVIECLKQNFFNDSVWPDLCRLSAEESPFLRFVALHDGIPIQVGELTVIPVKLDHVVPTFGFIVDDGESAIAMVSDTGPTEQIWNVARRNDRLKCVILESAFPNSMTWLAKKAKHLTPQLLEREYAKLDRQLRVLVVHIKPAYYEEVKTELQALELQDLEIATPNHVYDI